MKRTNDVAKFVSNKHYSSHNNVGIIGVSCAHLYEDGMLRSMNPNVGNKMLVFKICQFVFLTTLFAILFMFFAYKTIEKKE